MIQRYEITKEPEKVLACFEPDENHYVKHKDHLEIVGELEVQIDEYVESLEEMEKDKLEAKKATAIIERRLDKLKKRLNEWADTPTKEYGTDGYKVLSDLCILTKTR